MHVKILLIFLALSHFIGEKFLPALLVLVIFVLFVENFSNIVMLYDEEMLSGFDKLDMEVHLMARVNRGRDACQRVGVGHQRVPIAHNGHNDTGPFGL